MTRTDMGTYVLQVPGVKLFNLQAVLFVTDFAVVPDAVVRRRVGDRLTLRWDLTALRQLRDVTHRVLLTIPATVQLRFDYYNSLWIADNRPRHRLTRPTNPFHPTVVIDEVCLEDAGNYSVEVRLNSSVHLWLNDSWQFTTVLVVDDAGQTDGPPVVVIVLATLLLASLVVTCVLLIHAVRHRRPSTSNNRSLPQIPLTPPQQHRSTVSDNDDISSYIDVIETDIFEEPGPPVYRGSRTYSEFAKWRRSRYTRTATLS